MNDRPDFFETCGAAFADGDWHPMLTVGQDNLPARMRMDMRAAGGPAQAAQLIDGWLNEPFPTSGEPMEHTALSDAPESAGAR